MAKLTWIIFAFCVISCSAHFGFGRRNAGINRRRIIKPTQRVVNHVPNRFENKQEEKKCYTLARRPFYMSRLVQYPCQRRQPGVPVLRWFMGPMGPICVSYVREPVYRYYKVPLCCPGYMADKNGKCSIARQRFSEPRRQTNDNMMRMASNMRQAMFMRAQKDITRRRAKFFMNMRDNMNKRRTNVVERPRKPFMMPKMMQSQRPKFPQMMNMFNMRRQNMSPPRMTVPRFNRPTPPMPHPVQQPPVSGRIIKIIRRIPFNPFMPRNMFTPRNPMPQQRKSIQKPPVPTVVLSGRSSTSPVVRMKKLHPQMPPFLQFSAPRIQQSFKPPQRANIEFQPSGFSEASSNQQPKEGFHDHTGHNHDHSHDEFSGDKAPRNSQVPSEIQADLPSEPVQMPELVVEQAPTVTLQESCISKLEAAVKSCLKKSNIDVPDVMSAFEPFNDDKSRVLCEAEDTIFDCISDAIKDCDQADDGAIARDMLLETAKTVQNMCELRKTNVAQSSPSQVSEGDTVATVENVDDIPTEVKGAPEPASNEEITIIEDTPKETNPSAQAVKEAIQHEVHVQEIRMKEYLLPILVGSGVGFMVLVLLLSLVICCCCKRRFKRKMKMAKELEKPPLKDGIYTIGIAPPRYEVNGIPPLYYEEAKGEKITSRSPAVLEGADKGEEATAEGTQM